jgi:D-alanyl-lipoteichoic acid acyltransferase DltB (MBOAT superfamily)
MLFSSGAEFLIVIAFLLLQWGVRKYLNLQWNRTILLIGNLLVLSTLISFATLGMHMLLSLLVFGILQLLTRSKKGTRIAALSILTLIALFCIRNYPKAFGFESFQLGNSPELLIQRLGISYILFRHIQSIVDTLKGRLVPKNPIDYINFILFFPNFLAGPIDKFSSFQRHFKRKEGKLKRALFWPGVGRITLGFLKKYAVIPLFSMYALSYEPFLEWMSPQTAILASAACYSAYIFLDFSGYSDIAIGTGYIMGIKTPENFDSPYLTTNIAAFWRKWHMTFSEFLRDLIFKPIVKLINKTRLKPFRNTVSIIGYFLTFFICGIWHGDTVNFVYWGLWHGLGLAIYKVWTSGSLYNRLHGGSHSGKQFMVTLSGVLLTFSFVTIGWLFFHYKGEDLTTVVETLLGMR